MIIFRKEENFFFKDLIDFNFLLSELEGQENPSSPEPGIHVQMLIVKLQIVECKMYRKF